MRQVYDSDGQRFRQLVKSGQDDMRQDAVMQQFFELVNVLLATDPATRKRQLHIVTYKVEPWSKPTNVSTRCKHGGSSWCSFKVS